ncbi:MAG: MmcQ/YjbR family DNA-binding protein [Myxococcota bacterium]|nr:MmcQ/YjbR family DNA-binding protein [Myxococcota bacterium]
MNWKQLVRLGLALPEVAEGIWYRTPSLEVRGTSFVRLKEDGKDVVFLTETIEEQEVLCEARPAIYHITDHYRGSAAVLARLGKLTASEARVRLERAWRTRAPKRLLKTFDAR